MTYKRMTEADRRQIHRWRQEGHGLREIARRLGRAASSISRELSRN
ncbi:MAG: helix-turn-helix domain-containing protein, partial [SAR324 cluster bacterium]|nr:helix-turn-helix domain-containing protein [SAR324 cluster bacterium]